MSGLPLSRIRVLDLTLIWAGPNAVMMLGDLGAEIVRIESTQHHITNTRGFVPRPSKETVQNLGYLGSLYADLDPGDAGRQGRRRQPQQRPVPRPTGHQASTGGQQPAGSARHRSQRGTGLDGHGPHRSPRMRT